MTRSVNLDSPFYLEGQSWANRVLDHRSDDAQAWIFIAEGAAARFHDQEDVDAYHRARGFLDTLRDYTQDQAL